MFKKDYVWMLQDKFTGEVQENYTYTTRYSARKATMSRSKRFKDYRPIKIANSQLSKFYTKPMPTATKTGRCSSSKTKTTMSLKKTGFGFPIAKASYVGK